MHEDNPCTIAFFTLLMLCEILHIMHYCKDDKTKSLQQFWTCSYPAKMIQLSRCHKGTLNAGFWLILSCERYKPQYGVLYDSYSWILTQNGLKILHHSNTGSQQRKKQQNCVHPHKQWN